MRHVVQVWDAQNLEDMGADDVEGIEPVLSVVAHDDSTMESYVVLLGNLIEMSDNGDVSSNWIVTSTELREPTPGDMKSLADFFNQAVKEVG